MKLVPAMLLAVALSATASATDNPVFTTHRSQPVVGQTIGYCLHSDECGCSTCAPSCAAPAACCEPSCAAPAACCEPSCAAPAACCEPSCAAPCDSCAPAENACHHCRPQKKSVFSRVMDLERRKNRWLLSLIGR